MADLSLDLDPADIGQSFYKDLLLVNGDLCLTSDANPDGTNAILQNILQNLRFFLAEWFLDNTQGLPYFQQILVKNPDQSKIDTLFRNAIMGTPGVEQLSSYSSQVNAAFRILTVSFKCITTQGVVVFNGTVPVGNILTDQDGTILTNQDGTPLSNG